MELEWVDQTLAYSGYFSHYDFIGRWPIIIIIIIITIMKFGHYFVMWRLNQW